MQLLLRVVLFLLFLAWAFGVVLLFATDHWRLTGGIIVLVATLLSIGVEMLERRRRAGGQETV